MLPPKPPYHFHIVSFCHYIELINPHPSQENRLRKCVTCMHFVFADVHALFGQLCVGMRMYQYVSTYTLTSTDGCWHFVSHSTISSPFI